MGVVTSSLDIKGSRKWPLRRRRGLRTAIAVAVAVAMAIAPPVTVAGAASPWRVGTPAGLTLTAAASSLPTTPVSRQARWFLAALDHLPIPAGTVRAHFDSTFLAQVTTPQLNAALQQIGPLRLVAISSSTPSTLVFTAVETSPTEVTVHISVDGQGLIDGLLLTPTAASSWAGVDTEVRSVAPTAHLLVAELNKTGGCEPLHAIDPSAPAPLGSAFKLYVLDALAGAIASGRVRWGQEMTVTDQVKSLPSGELQNDPAGTKVSVLKVATNMISISDNTAADMLIGLVGRVAVEAATRSAGMADPSLDVPFLTTRELFILKLADWPHLAARYLALSPGNKQAFLTNTVDPTKPTSSLVATGPWTAPRDVNSIEWFASADDMCQVYSSLFAAAQRPRLSDVAQVLEVNDGGIGLPPAQWKSVWFKGGSEPGVLTLNYLATTQTGRTFVVSVLTENAHAPIPETSAAISLLGAIKGAFELAASSAH